MAHVLGVGKLYVAGKSRWSPGAEYTYRAGRHQLLIIQDRLTARDIEAVWRGPADFGLYVAPPALFFLYRFRDFGPWSDAPYTWYREREADRKPPFEIEPGSGALLQTILVESTTGVIKALRANGLAHGFSVALHRAITEQIEAGRPGEDAYNAAVDAAYRRYPDSDGMAADAIARCGAGEP